MAPPFPDLTRTIDLHVCVRCRAPFRVGDAVQQVWFVAGVGPHPDTGHRAPYLMDAPAFGHGRCTDRTLDDGATFIEIPRRALQPANNVELRPRTPEYQCHVCKRPLARGDAIVTVTRVLGIGVDPATRFPGVEVSSEFEAVHFDCHDPRLDLGGPLVVAS